MDIFSESNDVIIPFKSLTTFHQQLNFYKENFNLIVSPVDIYFNFHSIEQMPKRKLFQKNIFSQQLVEAKIE